MITKSNQNNMEVLKIETGQLKVSVVPAMGGKISSIYNKQLNREFLWINNNVPFTTRPAGSVYDPYFIGGIDELIPNDIPEKIDGLHYPDHGELWTTSLEYEIGADQLKLSGILPISQLHYSKTILISEDLPEIECRYNIRNTTTYPVHFLWKLHAALNIEAGDKLVTSAKMAMVADPAYSRFKDSPRPFEWPLINNTDASLIPARDGTMDFFYLYDIPVGSMQLRGRRGARAFRFSYDNNVFPYQWWFASYGGFLNHYTGVVEPCTNMPISVNDAIQEKQCAVLEAGETLSTTVKIFAGELNYMTNHEQ